MANEKEPTAIEVKREAQIEALMVVRKDKEGKDVPPRARSRAHAKFLIKAESV